jgi:hypothetical protein
MKLTDTLDFLLRLVLTTNQEDARQPSRPPSTSEPSSDTGPEPEAEVAEPVAANAIVDEPDSASLPTPVHHATVATPPAPDDGSLARLEASTEVAESLNLGYHLGVAVERIGIAAQQGSKGVPALREAIWLIERYIELVERRAIGADIHAASASLARTGESISELSALADRLRARWPGSAGGVLDAESPAAGTPSDEPRGEPPFSS